MRTIKTIAIDDEPLALSLLSKYIQQTDYLELTGEFDNPLEAVEFLNNNFVELIFIDIQMPDLTGIELIKSLLHPPKVIFTTAFEKYALEGFKVNATDYLLKPFSYDEFSSAAQKAKKIIELELNATPEAETNNEFLFLKSEYKIRKIRFDDILYIEGLKDYIKVHLLSSKKPVLSINTIKSLEKKLPSSSFMRVHRSFIVNLEKVDVIERGRVVFGDKYISVSEQYKEAFQNYVKNNML